MTENPHQADSFTQLLHHQWVGLPPFVILFLFVILSFCNLSFVPLVCYCFRMFVLYLFNGLIKKNLFSIERLIFSASMTINSVFVRTNSPTFLSVFLITHIPAISDVFRTHLLPRCCIFLLWLQLGERTIFSYGPILGNCIARHKRPSEKRTVKKAVKTCGFPAFRRSSDPLLSCSWRSLFAHAQKWRAAGRVPGADRAAALAQTG